MTDTKTVTLKGVDYPLETWEFANFLISKETTKDDIDAVLLYLESSFENDQMSEYMAYDTWFFEYTIDKNKYMIFSSYMSYDEKLINGEDFEVSFILALSGGVECNRGVYSYDNIYPIKSCSLDVNFYFK